MSRQVRRTDPAPGPEVMGTPCPSCEAPAWSRCRGPYGGGTTTHAARIKTATAQPEVAGQP